MSDCRDSSLDNRARQQSLKTPMQRLPHASCLTKPVMGETLHCNQNSACLLSFMTVIMSPYGEWSYYTKSQTQRQCPLEGNKVGMERST